MVYVLGVFSCLACTWFFFGLVLLCITLIGKAEKGKANLENQWVCCLARIYISVLLEFNTWNHTEINGCNCLRNGRTRTIHADAEM